MLSGKTMYYNSIKTETKAESQVTLANGSAAPTTQLGEHFCQYQHRHITRTVNILRSPCHVDNSTLSCKITYKSDIDKAHLFLTTVS